MFKLELNPSEKIVLFDLLSKIDENEIRIKLDKAEQKLISDMVVQMEPVMEDVFSPDYDIILERAKKEILSEWETDS